MQPTHELIEATSHLLPTNRSTSSCCPTPLLLLLRLSLANMVLVQPLFHKEVYVNPVQMVS